MRNEETEVRDPWLLQVLREDPTIADAEERYRQFVADDELRERYEGRIKFLMDQAANKRWIEEHARQEGLQRGLEQGRNEARKAKDEMIKRMKDAGIDAATIVEVSGLCAEEIELL